MREIELRNNVRIHNTVFIADNATIIGNVSIGEDSSVWFNAVVRGDMEPIVIGKLSNVQDGVIVHVDYDYPTTIGDRVTIGHGAVLHGCTIGNNVLIGIRSVLLNGVKIGDNSVIGAGAVIPENTEIPPNSIALGIPGKVKGDTTEVHKARIKMNAEIYVMLAQTYIKGYKVKRG